MSRAEFYYLGGCIPTFAFFIAGCVGLWHYKRDPDSAGGPIAIFGFFLAFFGVLNLYFAAGQLFFPSEVTP